MTCMIYPGWNRNSCGYRRGPFPAQDLIRHIHFRFEADVSAAGLDLLVALRRGNDDDTSSPNRSLQVSVDIERIDRVFWQSFI